MIEVRAEKRADGVEITTNVDADAVDYVVQIVCIIEALMRDAKEKDPLTHSMILQVIAEHPAVLLGEGEAVAKKASEKVN